MREEVKEQEAERVCGRQCRLITLYAARASRQWQSRGRYNREKVAMDEVDQAQPATSPLFAEYADEHGPVAEQERRSTKY